MLRLKKEQKEKINGVHSPYNEGHYAGTVNEESPDVGTLRGQGPNKMTRGGRVARSIRRGASPVSNHGPMWQIIEERLAMFG